MKKRRKSFARRTFDLNVKRIATVAFALTLSATGAVAGNWPPSGQITRWSRDHRIQATSYATNETMVFQLNPFRLLWKFPRAFCAFEVSNDGETIVAETLFFPLKAGVDEIALTFIVDGKVVREITLRQLIGSRSKLVQVTPDPNGLCVPSGNSEVLSWGHGLCGIDENGFVLVDTTVGFFIFDAHTAKCVFPPNNRIDPVGAR